MKSERKYSSAIMAPRAVLCALLLALMPACALGDAAADNTQHVYSYDDMTVSFAGGGLLNTSDGESALVLYYDFTNDKSKAESFIYSFAATVYQDGVECDPAYSWDFDVAPEDAYTALLSVKDGATIRVAKYFRIHNTTSPVEVELSRMFAFGSQPMAMTLELPDVTVSSSAMASDDVQEIVIEFTVDEAHAITTAALMEGKTPAQWLHDIALETAG